MKETTPQCENHQLHPDRIERAEKQIPQEGEMIALEYLCRIFQLESLDYYLLTMALAAELDGQFEQIFRLGTHRADPPCLGIDAFSFFVFRVSDRRNDRIGIRVLVSYDINGILFH